MSGLVTKMKDSLPHPEWETDDGAPLGGKHLAHPGVVREERCDDTEYSTCLGHPAPAGCQLSYISRIIREDDKMREEDSEERKEIFT
jgi:hypothetical protein